MGGQLGWVEGRGGERLPGAESKGSRCSREVGATCCWTPDLHCAAAAAGAGSIVEVYAAILLGFLIQVRCGWMSEGLCQAGTGSLASFARLPDLPPTPRLMV